MEKQQTCWQQRSLHEQNAKIKNNQKKKERDTFDFFLLFYLRKLAHLKLLDSGKDLISNERKSMFLKQGDFQSEARCAFSSFYLAASMKGKKIYQFSRGYITGLPQSVRKCQNSVRLEEGLKVTEAQMLTMSGVDPPQSKKKQEEGKNAWSPNGKLFTQPSLKRTLNKESQWRSPYSYCISAGLLDLST